MPTINHETSPSVRIEEIPVLGFDRIEFYVGNAKQAAFFYNKLFGFDIIGYRGPENGCRETVSYLLQQDRIRFILTAALRPEHPIAHHVARHGDGIRDIGLRVEDAESCFQTAVSRGAPAVSKPAWISDDSGKFRQATVATFGDTTHTFLERHHPVSSVEPGFEPFFVKGQAVGLEEVDHAVGNVEENAMEHWVRFYECVFGFTVFRHFDKRDISTQFSALVSKVMTNQSKTIKLPINEPAEGLKRSQIQEYLDFYASPGVQHLAIRTGDILTAVQQLRQNGVQFMQVPKTYYDGLLSRVGEISEPVAQLADLGILVDRDEAGYLLQIFTQPLQDRPTMFFEIIQRQGSEGFGKGNFKALFEAIERDQARRGNL